MDFEEVDPVRSCDLYDLDPVIMLAGGCVGLLLAVLLKPAGARRSADEIEENLRDALASNKSIQLDETHSSKARRHIAISLDVTKQFVNLSSLSCVLGELGASLTGLSQTDYPNARNIGISIDEDGGVVEPSPRSKKIRYVLCVVIVICFSLIAGYLECLYQ